MAKNKKLNKAARARMARTGESYSTARMHVLARLEGLVEAVADDVARNPDKVEDQVAIPAEIACGGPTVVAEEEAGNEPKSLILTEWMEDPNPRLPKGTLTRFLQSPASSMAGAKPLIVVPADWGWKVILLHGKNAPIDGMFAAPSSKIACLYADDYLHHQGFVGPGIGPLPEGYPPLRSREDAWVPSEHERGVLNRGAKCDCGYVGEAIVNRYQPCPSCGGIAIIMAETLRDLM